MVLAALKVWMGDSADEEVKEEGRIGGGVVTIPLGRRELGWREGDKNSFIAGLGIPQSLHAIYTYGLYDGDTWYTGCT